MDETVLRMDYLLKLEEYMGLGNMTAEFINSGEDRRMEMLEFLEKLMDLGDLADKTASRIIFRNSQLGALMGETASAQEDNSQK